MSIALVDVDVLVALFDPGHRDHEAAHQWFGCFATPRASATR